MAYIPNQKKKSSPRESVKRFGDDSFYNKTKWRKTSKAMIADFVICPVCEENPSQVTDHVVPRPDGADYDKDNLLPMCHRCHNRKRGKEANTNDYLVDTRHSDTEQDKLVPVDKFDIVRVLKRKGPEIFYRG